MIELPKHNSSPKQDYNRCITCKTKKINKIHKFSEIVILLTNNTLQQIKKQQQPSLNPLSGVSCMDQITQVKMEVKKKKTSDNNSTQDKKYNLKQRFKTKLDL